MPIVVVGTSGSAAAGDNLASRKRWSLLNYNWRARAKRFIPLRTSNPYPLPYRVRSQIKDSIRAVATQVFKPIKKL
jgi:hypothetical protein